MTITQEVKLPVVAVCHCHHCGVTVVKTTGDLVAVRGRRQRRERFERRELQAVAVVLVLKHLLRVWAMFDWGLVLRDEGLSAWVQLPTGLCLLQVTRH